MQPIADSQTTLFERKSTKALRAIFSHQSIADCGNRKIIEQFLDATPYASCAYFRTHTNWKSHSIFFVLCTTFTTRAGPSSSQLLPSSTKPKSDPDLRKEEALMFHYVISRGAHSRSQSSPGEARVGADHLIVPVEADVCDECGRPTTRPRLCDISNKCGKTSSAKSSLRPRLDTCTRFLDGHARLAILEYLATATAHSFSPPSQKKSLT